ncbi:MFS transporter [Pseudoclavibacter sp. AY1F1]|uniref:MFS transporter n=1 Tax=Pseudoclavibacter sp. AY1F1 TaxID=2080583 RepID=UPI000CE90E82|nr:MFS transporter [Pseudoclavibacter sp. AY1F1]PPF45975.1 MFS transporter [Pseudoclavibacter sp. AY1F1]
MNLLPVTYLTSHVLSLLGNSIAGIALPLIVLSTTGSALGAGTVAAATAIPAVLAGLFMGVVIDRINRRTSSVVTDLISAASIAALPIIDLVSGLNLGWFVLFGIIGSLGDVPGMTAREALLPAIVRHSNISAERLMGVRESLSAVAIFIGPAAAGTLMVLFDGSTVLWVTAATSLLAALITLIIPRAVGEIVADDGSRASTPVGTGWSQLRDGWRALFRSPFLVATTALSLVSVFVLAGLQGLVLPVYFTQVEQPGLLGFVLSALALGMLVGGGTYAVAGTRGPRRAWFVVGMIGTTVGIGLISLLTAVWVVFAGAFVMGVASGLFGSLMGVLMIERIPEQLRGRIMGTQNALTTAAPSVGIMLAALLTEYASVNAAALVLLGAWGCAFVYGLAARPLRTLEPQAASVNAGGVR